MEIGAQTANFGFIYIYYSTYVTSPEFYHFYHERFIR